MSDNLLHYFTFAHLPENLQTISQPFFALAVILDTGLPESNEKDMALRKLLESKDCAVRAAL